MMLRLTLGFISSICLLITLHAQPTAGLVAHYRFDGSLEDATGNTSNTGEAVGTPAFACGIDGQALFLDGANDQVRIPTTAAVAGEFDTEDFTISMYYKPVGLNGIQYLVSKRDTGCMNGREFFLRFVPLSNTLNLVLGQDVDKRNDLLAIVENQVCWQHVLILRDANRTKLYLNGVEVADQGAASRVNLESRGPLFIGGGECLGGVETPFAGLIDEVKIYSRALDRDEILSLYLQPDQIATNDTIIFQGNSVDVDLGPNCGTSYTWTPADNVSPADSDMPSIFGADPGIFTYNVSIRDEVSTCVARDSIQITVVDPNTLPCQVAMPKAFTPNRDQLNDNYGLSNPFAITDMISFEIFDRWGGKVFTTASPFDKWDGTFQGDRVNPGVFLWRVAYRCSGEERIDTGTVTVLR